MRLTAAGNSLQERWLYEAVLGSYVPLLMAFGRLRQDNVPCRATFSLSPTLLAMLSDEGYRRGIRRHLDLLLELAEKERQRTAGTEHGPVAAWYAAKLEETGAFLDGELGGDVLSGFRGLAEDGRLELITSAATHGYLPLMQSRQAVKAQVETGLDEFARVMGRRPAGIWLPECGFAPGFDQILAAAGVRFFFTDAHVIEHGRPRPVAGVYRPVVTPAGVAAFGRDPESSRQVWDRHSGYPGDPVYREFYRDIGWDLPLDYIGPYVLGGGVRADTGFKYQRITGPGDDKGIYEPAPAARRAAEHARHFVAAKEEQVGRLAAGGLKDPVIVAPFDAELFGHWWLEGPLWVEGVCRSLAGSGTLAATVPSACLDRSPAGAVTALSAGSWGAGGYNEVWLNGANDWLYPRLHGAEERMAGLARVYPAATGLRERALKQAARELLLAQSSDWAFMITMGSAADYAASRAVAHLEAFDALYEGIVGWTLKEDRLSELEETDRLFPRIDYRLYGGPAGPAFVAAARAGRQGSAGTRTGRGAERPLRILMLSWEFPPFVVGGLGQHMDGLARCLSDRGSSVTVITASHPGVVPDERRGRLRVRRVGPEPDRGGDFLGWVYAFNEAVVRQASVLMGEEQFDLIHAHDWMVGPAAAALKERFGIPLVVTIHATEHGRNGGLATELQHAIHREEWRLTHEADRVIACSRYMVEEVTRLFAVPPGKATMIPNGVDAGPFGARFTVAAERRRHAGPGGKVNGKVSGKVILYVGRLVAEKGVQVLLEAVPTVIDRCPEALVLIAGRGPFEGELRALAARLGVEGNVRFLGYIDEEEKHQLMREAAAVAVPSLYEPFGIIALEAMAAGTPVVASETGGLVEIVENGVTGLMVPPGRAGALAGALIRVLGDEVLAGGLAVRAAVAVRDRFSWEAVSDTTRSLYEETLAG